MSNLSYKNNYYITIIVLLQLLFLDVTGQISINFPTNRIVFQRDNQNIGFINIIGNYTQPIDRVEAKLTPITVGQGTETDWVLLQDSPKAGYFAGRIQGMGGWYKLEVRAIKGNTILKIATVDKVGIGEVFIALGQSNAQGIPNYGAKGAIDDRVNAINFQNSQVLDPLPENLNFVHLSEDVNIAPQGDGPWCYGELGDRLVKKLNVPVAFFNEGLLLVSVINWRESAEGLPTYNFVLDVGGRFQLPKGLPYVNLKNTLRYYGALMGVRSLLWIQGETDNSPNKLSANDYATNLQRVIDISRRDFDNNLTWVVSRTSVTYMAPSNAEIINGQNNIIEKKGNNVFTGPFTDNLQIPRLDDVHFKNIPGNMGISLLAESWDNALNDNFFKNSTPILAKNIVEPEITCDTDGKVALKISGNFKADNWLNDGKNTSIIISNGEYTSKIFDDKGNRRLFPTINTSYVLPSTVPTVKNTQGLNFCENTSPNIELIADGQDFSSFVWSSGETSKQIVIQKAGSYSVVGRNIYGCYSQSSEKITTKSLPVPVQPILAKLGVDSLIVQNTSFTDTDQFEWIQDGSLKYYTNKPIFKVPYTGSYTISVIRSYQNTDAKILNCVSPISNSIYAQSSANTLLLATETDSLYKHHDFTLFPNPIDKKVTILPLQQGIFLVAIFSLEGKKVFEQEVEIKPDVTLNLGNLTAGTYILELNGTHLKQRKRIVIN